MKLPAMVRSKELWIGLLVGVVATLLLLYRKQITALWTNREMISDGSKVVGGASDLLDGLKGLWKGF